MKKKTNRKKAKSKSSKAKKKTVKKTTGKSAKAKRPKTAKAKAPAKKAKTVTPVKPQIKGDLIGAITHYFPHVEAAVVKINKGQIRAGDRLYFKGHTTDFEIAVTSMQMDHAPIEVASKGDEIGIQVPQRVREGDSVYKL